MYSVLAGFGMVPQAMQFMSVPFFQASFFFGPTGWA